MFTTVTGHYDGHNIVLDEEAEIKEGTQVLVTVLNINIEKMVTMGGVEKPRDLNEAIDLFKRTYNIR